MEPKDTVPYSRKPVSEPIITQFKPIYSTYFP